MEEHMGGIPEELRCKRSDGKQWRCNALSMPDKTVCEKHYYQAKKRAANSAMRASLKKAKRSSYDDDAYAEGSRHSTSPLQQDPLNKYKEKLASLYTSESKKSTRGFTSRSFNHGSEEHTDGMDVDEEGVRSYFSTPPTSKEARNFTGSSAGDYSYSGRSSDSSADTKGLTCHQCRRNDKTNVVKCLNCDRRGYCSSCISRCYPDMPVNDIRRVCPACRNICSCRVCMRGDNLIKIRVQELPALERLRHLHKLLTFVLPMLKEIHAEQCFEISIETRLSGIKTEIPRARINADEQMCCDLCKIPIFDYHRHCTNCMYDLCLSCCRDLRQASHVAFQGDSMERRNCGKGRDTTSATQTELLSNGRLNGGNTLDMSHLYPKWKANKDGSIPCPPVEVNGCGSSKLVLRRILKVNWVSKLVKNAEEMVNGCKVPDVKDEEGCCFCATAPLHSVESKDGKIQANLLRDDNTNFLYCPDVEDLKNGVVDHFHKHWTKGEVIIVKRAFASSLASSWDPMSLWKGIQDMEDDREDSITVKAINCLDHSEVDIKLEEFIKGYHEGCKREDRQPKVLKLKDWPPASVLEEFLLCHRPEFLSNLPLLEFIHSRWGLVNLAAKLPADTAQTEMGPRIFISYGMHEEDASGEAMSNLQMNMNDLVYLLMHTSKCDDPVRSSSRKTSICNGVKGTDLDSAHKTSLNSEDESMKGERHNVSSSDKENLDLLHTAGVFEEAPGTAFAGAIWDVFRREDVQKLNEYMRAHQQELTRDFKRPFVSVMLPIYDETFFLNNDHKRKLKEEYGVEPWTFKQHIGEAIFIPAGCPFQVRNVESSVQLGLDFLLPESLHESVRLAQEIRCLPNDHDAKLKMLEVGKISLYAASWAIREIQKLTLDPKFCSEFRFEYRNLTEMVSQNLEKMTKDRHIRCT